MTDSSPILHVERLSIAVEQAGATRRLVDEISFTIAAGEKLALVGESGSGKSITALSVLRLLDPRVIHYPTGKILWHGRNLLTLSPHELRQVRGREIGMIFQEPMSSLNPVLTVGEQIMEPLFAHQSLSRKAARQRALELLERTGIDRVEQRFKAYPHMLSGGQRQRVMIAMALSCGPQLLLADEPTTALDVTVQAQILKLLAELQRDMGMAVLLISHDLNIVRRFADRICVMQKGKIVERAETEQLFLQPTHAYTQQLLNSQPPPQILTRPTQPDEKPLLVAVNIYCKFTTREGPLQRARELVAVNNAGLEIFAGETVGVVGESGSGKSTLGLCLLQLQECRGEIAFAGHNLRTIPAKQLRSLRQQFQVVFQDPYASLHPRRTVEQIITEGLLIHEPSLSAGGRRQRAVDMLAEVGLQADMLQRYPHEFSGGQRQRIAIARAVILNPRLIILDEPTSALDATVQKQVLALLGDLQRRRGISYLFISHDLRVIRAMAHRIVVMRRGEIVEQGDAATLFSTPHHPYTHELLSAALQ